MTTTLVDFGSDQGLASYKEKVYINNQVFRTLFGGSPSDFADKLEFPEGPNLDLINLIHKKYEVSLNYVKGINLSDECINLQSAAHLQQYLHKGFGCTSIAKQGVIGQTLDLFTVELCIVREGGCLYVTMPPYLCLLGLGPSIAMCTNHLFDQVRFSGIPVSFIRRQLLRCKSLEDAVDFLSKCQPTTSVNFMLSDGKKVINVEVSRKGIRVLEPEKDQLAHTNHVISTYQTDKFCPRLNTARKLLSQGEEVAQILDADGIVQPIQAEFGTIISVWIDPKTKTLGYRDPDQKTYTQLTL